jgi:hypothetical protein
MENELSQIAFTLPARTETGKLQIMHLKRYWSKLLAKRSGKLEQNALDEEWKTDVTLLSSLGLGIEQTIKYVYAEAPDFNSFEDWILEVNGGMVSQEKILQFNKQLTAAHSAEAEGIKKVLNVEDLAFWDMNGYIILRKAVPKEDCEKTVSLICDHLGIKRDDPATWYNAHKDKQGIMVQLFQHPQLQKNRDTEIIRLAYEQLWGRKDIWVNADRVGFNPPETDTYKFPGPSLHWDVSLELPIPFGLQGILYLADTRANQGAFTLVPGFQNRIEEWLNSLPPDTNPRTEDIYALGAMPIAANAGDFIIWHHALPHGSSPNTAKLPRFVQYINYEPLNPEVNPNWK